MRSDPSLDGGEVRSFRRFWRQEFSAGGGLTTRILSQRLGAIFAYLSSKAGVSPNLLTMLATVVSIAGSLLFAFGDSGWKTTSLCVLLYQVAYGFDCADGQLARSTGRSSPFGAWLDVCGDLFSLIFMAFAVLYWLESIQAASGVLLYVGPFLLCVGRVLVLYSSKFAERLSGENKPAGQSAGVLKSFLWFILDTPTLLLAVCLLRDAPVFLVSYLSVMGLLYILNAGYLGVSRLAKA